MSKFTLWIAGAAVLGGAALYYVHTREDAAFFNGADATPSGKGDGRELEKVAAGTRTASRRRPASVTSVRNDGERNEVAAAGLATSKGLSEGAGEATTRRTQSRATGASGGRSPASGRPPSGGRAAITGGVIVEQRFKPFFDSMGTDPAVRAQVIAATEAYEARFGATMRNARNGITSEQSAAATELRHQYAQQMTELLGADGAKALDEYGNVQVFVPVAQEFANRCVAAGVPISDTLVASIAANYAQNLPYPDFVAPTAEMAKANEQINVQREAHAIEAARKVLTPQQLEIFRRYWAERPYPEKP